MRYHSDEDDWHVMFERFKEETDPSEKNKIMTGLAGIRSTEILKELVKSTINNFLNIYFLFKINMYFSSLFLGTLLELLMRTLSALKIS